MRLKSIELSGFKSFPKKTQLQFDSAITAIVGPNGSGKSNIAEAFRFALGEQSMKSMRGKRGEDMVWNGSNLSSRAGRAGVCLVLDNADRTLNLDFDEVSIERVVRRDGANEYLLNSSSVRLRDIAELLSQANIGASGHQIISQGEADRALSASVRERREMLEDALGLTAYLYKREEAQRKLLKTSENMREVEALRRELSPHLKFLGAQVKKIEEGEHLRQRTQAAYLEYLKREEVYVRVSSADAQEERSEPAREKREIDAKIAHLRAEVEKKSDNDHSSRELVKLEADERYARSARETLTRELGRIEGELTALARLKEETPDATVPAKDAARFAQEVAAALEKALQGDTEALKKTAAHLISAAREFAARVFNTSLSKTRERAKRETIERKGTLEGELAEARMKEEHVAAAVERLRREIESGKDATRDAERELFSSMARRSELETELSRVSQKQELLAREQERFKEELREAGALIGRAILEYETYAAHDEKGNVLSEADLLQENRESQETRRRALERMKVRLEELGAGSSSEVLKEHRETLERDEFLSRELADLSASVENLRTLIDELSATLQTRFAAGIDTISAQFNEFFKLMFGGGEAELAVVKERRVKRGASIEEEENDEDPDAAEKEEYEEGVEVSVSLPHKRLKGLNMLSGGERALASIALIFAMSQVNPPPFLILDETDAALDEANSRRYGDMLETLARRSQLIVITHNRETMSRAGTLYGVTMGGDGASKLLSVRFGEAVAVAK